MHLTTSNWLKVTTIIRFIYLSLIIFCTKPHSYFNLLQTWATFQSLISICAVLCLVIQSHLILWDPMDGIFVTPWTVAHQSLLSMGILQARILEWVSMPSSRVSSQPRNWTQVSCITGGVFTTWATRNPKNTGVGCLSLLQENFPTQGLLHCSQILYHLSYQGSCYLY